MQDIAAEAQEKAKQGRVEKQEGARQGSVGRQDGAGPWKAEEERQGVRPGALVAQRREGVRGSARWQGGRDKQQGAGAAWPGRRASTDPTKGKESGGRRRVTPRIHHSGQPQGTGRPSPTGAAPGHTEGRSLGWPQMRGASLVPALLAAFLLALPLGSGAKHLAALRRLQQKPGQAPVFSALAAITGSHSTSTSVAARAPVELRQPKSKFTRPVMGTPAGLR